MLSQENSKTVLRGGFFNQQKECLTTWTCLEEGMGNVTGKSSEKTHFFPLAHPTRTNFRYGSA